MRTTRVNAVLIALFALCTGCSFEGDDAGECHDGLDNDGDGTVDCDDEGCAIALACEAGVETDDDSAEDPSGDDDALVGDPRHVSAGVYHSCAIGPDGTPRCWGCAGLVPDYGQCMDEGAQAIQIAVGTYHTCALGTGSEITCWGGVGSYGSQPEENEIPLATYVQVALGNGVSWGLRADGELRAFGDSFAVKYDLPEVEYHAMSATEYNICALRTDGGVECAVNQYYGEDSGLCSPPDDEFSQVSAGKTHACGVRLDGTVRCWGPDWHGAADPPDGAFTQVGCGEAHTCGLRLDGTVECWGCYLPDYDHGQCDAPDGLYRDLDAGMSHTCALTMDGGVECWGDDSHGQCDAPSM